MRAPGVRSFRDLSANRRNVHAIRAGPPSRDMGLDAVRPDLGSSDLRGDYENDAWDVASFETGVISLPRHEMAGTHRIPTAKRGSSGIGSLRAVCRWHRLYSRRDLFRQRATQI